MYDKFVASIMKFGTRLVSEGVLKDIVIYIIDKLIKTTENKSDDQFWLILKGMLNGKVG